MAEIGWSKVSPHMPVLGPVHVLTRGLFDDGLILESGAVETFQKSRRRLQEEDRLYTTGPSHLL